MLEQRSDQQEIMDDLDISGPVVPQTLRELNTINKTLGGNRVSVSAFKKMVKKDEKTILADLGCGGGDIMMQMAKWAGKRQLKASFEGIDANPHIVRYASEHTRKFPEIRYQCTNIFSDTFKNQRFDIIHCCLFLHHFSDAQLVDLFRQFRAQAKLGVIVNDLHRHPLAYWSIKWLTRLFSRSAMVRNDAAISVARGFKRQELEEILQKAGIDGYSLVWQWAFRWKLIF